MVVICSICVTEHPICRVRVQWDVGMDVLLKYLWNEFSSCECLGSVSTEEHKDKGIN